MTAHEIFARSLNTGVVLFISMTVYFVIYHPPKPADARWYHKVLAFGFFGSIAGTLISIIGLIWT